MTFATKDPLPSHTLGKWDFACDSYGKVRHSRMACVYTNVRAEHGDMIVAVAARIPNWDDARLIAAAPDLLEAAKEALIQAEGCFHNHYPGDDPNQAAEPSHIAKLRAAIAKATPPPLPPAAHSARG